MTLENAPMTKLSVNKVGIIAKTRLDEIGVIVAEVKEWLLKHGVSVVVENETAKLLQEQQIETCLRDKIAAVSDLILVLGGDGTLLGVAALVAKTRSNVPLLAVNFGNLGFLTETTLPELYKSLESVLAGTARIDERRMLKAQVIRENKVIVDRTALNDIVLSKAALSSIIDFAITLGDHFVMSSRADGLIIASPTGSTAYNMAAGGPIVHPMVDALLLTPIAPHTLTNRPIVIPTDSALCVTPALTSPHQSAYISFDGQFGFELAPGDNISIEKSDHTLKVVSAESRNYFAVLREKLRWSKR